MSICGSCPYPYEAHDNDYRCQEDGCSFEDAVYRGQWAYDQLYERYIKLKNFLVLNYPTDDRWYEIDTLTEEDSF